MSVGRAKPSPTARTTTSTCCSYTPPPSEEKFVADGFGVDRHQVMYNDFVLIGPAADPAGVKGKDIPTALKTFAEKKIPFVSRGDNSGTHNTEKQLWKVAGMEVPGKDATWYIDAGQGMMATIRIAAEKDGYTVTDRGTYIKYNAAAKGDAPLKILVEGDKALLNQYSVMMVNPAKCPKVKQEAAKKFINWWISPNTQKAIASFQLEGKQLFFPNAKAGK
ncbi:MAG: substrate-binding domain-containing protein [Bilophila wadsworthia]